MMNHSTRPLGSSRPRGPSGPVHGMARDGAGTAGTVAALLGTATALGVVDLDAQQIAQISGLAGVAAGGFVAAGKDFRNFRHEGRGGLFPWMGSWLFRTRLIPLILVLGFAAQASAQTYVQEYTFSVPEPAANADNPATDQVDESTVPLADLESIELVIRSGGADIYTDTQPATGPGGGGTVDFTVTLSPGVYEVFATACSSAGRCSIEAGSPANPFVVQALQPIPLPPGSILVVPGPAILTLPPPGP